MTSLTDTYTRYIIHCEECDADCSVEHTLKLPYRLHFCPFCGSQLDLEDGIDENENFYDE